MAAPKSPTAPPLCPERPRTIWLVRARETDGLSRDDRRLVLDHISACGECRSTAFSIDPTLLFAPMADPAGDVAAGEGRKMAADVRAVLEAQRIDRRVRRPDRPVLKAAALLLLGAGLTGLISLHPWGGDAKVPGRVAAVTAATAATAVTAMTNIRAVPAASAPLIETVGSPGVKVYQFAADAPGQPAVVFVVDRNADL